MWQRNLNVLVRLDNQEWKVYLSKLKNDPPNVFRLGWGADYPDPDNFMKLFRSHVATESQRPGPARQPGVEGLPQQAQERPAQRLPLGLGSGLSGSGQLHEALPISCGNGISTSWSGSTTRSGRSTSASSRTTRPTSSAWAGERIIRIRTTS